MDKQEVIGKRVRVRSTGEVGTVIERETVGNHDDVLRIRFYEGPDHWLFPHQLEVIEEQKGQEQRPTAADLMRRYIDLEERINGYKATIRNLEDARHKVSHDLYVEMRADGPVPEISVVEFYDGRLFVFHLDVDGDHCHRVHEAAWFGLGDPGAPY